MEEQERAIIPAGQQAIMPGDSSWRTRTLMIGGLIGTVLGLIGAYLYLKAAEEAHGGEAPQGPRTQDAVKLGVSLLAMLRTITEWGRR